MDSRQLRDQVRDVLAQTFGISTTTIMDSFSNADLPAWDSLYHFTLIASLEDRFAVSYTSDEIPQMTNLHAIVESTAQHLSRKAAGH